MNWGVLVHVLFCTLQEVQSILPFSRSFTMVVDEKIYFEAYTNDQYIWHKNNIAQLCFILGTAELCRNVSSILNNDSDIHRLSNRKWLLTKSEMLENSPNLLNFMQSALLLVSMLIIWYKNNSQNSLRLRNWRNGTVNIVLDSSFCKRMNGGPRNLRQLETAL